MHNHLSVGETTNHLARRATGKGTIFYNEYAVHGDMRHTSWIAVRSLEGGRVSDRVRVKHHQISGVAWCEPPAAGEAQTAGGQGGHFAHGLGQRHEPTLAHKLCQETRIGAVAARMWLPYRQHTAGRQR